VSIVSCRVLLRASFVAMSWIKSFIFQVFVLVCTTWSFLSGILLILFRIFLALPDYVLHAKVYFLWGVVVLVVMSYLFLTVKGFYYLLLYECCVWVVHSYLISSGFWCMFPITSHCLLKLNPPLKNVTTATSSGYSHPMPSTYSNSLTISPS